MDQISKKVIRASAGTGKTYRLSVEYICLLLKYKNIDFDFREILVLTFTRKATAEIRERIFQHLILLLNKTGQINKERQNLIQIIETKLCFTLTDSDFAYLKKVYLQILTNKNDIQISTIDAFTNSIFRNMVAPEMGIIDYSIDPNKNKDYLPELYDALFSHAEWSSFKNLFQSAGYRSVTDYDKFILSIIKNRVLFTEYVNHIDSINNYKIILQSYKSDLEEAINSSFTIFEQYIKIRNKDIEWKSFFSQDFLLAFPALESEKLHNHMDTLRLIYSEDKNYINNSKLFLNKNFWNGMKILREKKGAPGEIKQEFLESWNNMKHKLANYLVLTLLYSEHNLIYKISEALLQQYDIIKLRDKIFTYDDISFYTYKSLRNPEISMSSGLEILNIFYEQLSVRMSCILIDEFQDTSILQWQIIYPLISELISGSGIQDKTNIVIVGDEKQAIYGWRGGERDLLLKVSDFLNMENNPEILNKTYRSQKNIQDFVNSTFSHTFLQSNLSNNNIYWPYQEVDVLKSKDQGYVETHLVNFGKTETRSEITKQELYQQIIDNKINYLIRNQLATPKDIAILARSNNELKVFAEVLIENGMDYILESSASILHHKAIKPIIYLMRFLLFEDFYDLYRFLRSDLVLMSPFTLKKTISFIKEQQEAVDDDPILEQLTANFENEPVFNKLNKIHKIYDKLNLLEFFKIIIEEFNIYRIFSSEYDLNNIQFFLEIVSEFRKNNTEYSTDLNGFYEYFLSLEVKEAYQQKGVNEANAIKLLTIHKSKGLEFDTVFFISEIKSKRRSTSREIKILYDLSNDFSQYQHLYFSFNYQFLIKHSDLKELSDLQNKKLITEELNNFYVAMTRAKTNLFVYCHFKKKGSIRKSLQTYKKEIETKELDILKLILLTLSNSENSELIYEDENEINLKKGELLKTDQLDIANENKQHTEKSSQRILNRYFDILHEEDIEKKNETENMLEINFKSMYLEKRSKIKGIIAHYYLSFIISGNLKERQFAVNQTIAEYGTLLKKEELDHILTIIDNFVMENLNLFDVNVWDTIFTEYSIFDSYGNEYRIDRLLIDSTNKKILIVDYKTGDIHDDKQLTNYRNILSNIPKYSKNYCIDTLFVELNLY